MKKIKKILAMVLALAMVLGMSMTTFAAEEATITVGNADEANLFYVYAIKPDQGKVTGWDFTSDAIAEKYMDALGATDRQVAIIMLAKVEDETAYDDLAIAAGVSKAEAAQIDQALSDIVNEGLVTTSMTSPMTVSEAGIYIIRAEETGYTYKHMAAYVGFGEAEDGTYPILSDAEITAKKSTTTITKENLGEAADNAVAVGDTVEFEVESSFPYVDINKQVNKKYVITDTITGAEFNRDTVKVSIGGDTTLYTVGEDAFSEDGKTLTIDLSDLITPENMHAGKQVVITYNATVTELSATNSVNHEITNVTSGDPAETHLYTGSLTITKYGENENTTLSGAEFVVIRKDSNDADEYATFDENMKLTGWTSDIDEAATRVTTIANGTATVNGLDQGTYWFKEVKAPTGYSINDDLKEVKLEIQEKDEETGAATANFAASTSMTDTKLSALPSTGGIGTTIFTIGGCAIMILAAALYFMTRRKSAK